VAKGYRIQRSERTGGFVTFRQRDLVMSCKVESYRGLTNPHYEYGQSYDAGIAARSGSEHCWHITGDGKKMRVDLGMHLLQNSRENVDSSGIEAIFMSIWRNTKELTQ
jgi:hypothetical protein